MTRTVRLALLLVPVAAVLAFVPKLAAREQDGTPKTLYFTATDKDSGKVITDLKADEIAVFEDKKMRQTISAKPAASPMSIVILADSSAAVGGGGIGQTRGSAAATAAGDVINDIRTACAEFAKQMLAANPKNEVALMEFGQASIMMVNFTSNAEDITKGLTHLVVKPSADSVLLEGIMEASKELGKRPNARKAIVAVNVLPDSDRSAEPANNIMKQIAKDGAMFFSASLQKGDLKTSVRGPVLDKFSELTGGKRNTIVGQSALTAVLKEFGDILNAQWEITYTRPNGAPPSLAQMATPRPNVKFYSPTFPPK